MAQSKIFLMIYLLCVNLFPILQGFGLESTHIGSPPSPLYQENLSDFQRFRKNVEVSRLGTSPLERWSENRMGESKVLRNSFIRLPLHYHRPDFTVKLTFGTPPVERTLVLHTSSWLTWTQCKPCADCFEQRQPLFDPKESSSYKPVTKKHKVAQKFICYSTNDGCHYSLHYNGGQISIGNAATEDFIFPTSSGQSHTQQGLVFGCGHRNRWASGFGQNINEVTGMIGMNRHPLSFVRQMGQVTKERFSYCLPTITNRPKQSYLRFGDEAIIRGRNPGTAPFLKGTNYKVALKDISVNGQRLGHKRGTFPGGCEIESGVFFTLLHNQANDGVRSSIIKYFSEFRDVKRASGGEIPDGHLCYLFPRNFREFPNMTYHFQGADLEIPPANVFSVTGSLGCLQIMGSADVTTAEHEVRVRLEEGKALVCSRGLFQRCRLI